MINSQVYDPDALAFMVQQEKSAQAEIAGYPAVILFQASMNLFFNQMYA